MKIRLTQIFSVLFIAALALPAVTRAGGGTVDQQNITGMDGNKSYAVEDVRGWGQIFVPTKTRIYQVDIPVIGINGENYKDYLYMQILAFNTNNALSQVQASISALNPEQVSWVPFTLPNPITVTPGTQYEIYVIHSGDATHINWLRSGSNAYSSGIMRKRTGPYALAYNLYPNDDFGFKVWGYTPAPINPATPTPAAPATSTPTPAVSTSAAASTDNGSTFSAAADTTESAPASTTSENTAAKEAAPVDTAITPPSLAYIVVNNEPQNAPIKNDVNVTDDSIKVSGTAPAGSKVLLMVGDSVFTATADEKGNWIATINSSQLKPGKYTVQAQVQDKSGKGSVLTDLFNLTKTAKAASAAATNTTSGTNAYADYAWPAVGILGVLALGSAFFVYKHRHPL